MKLLKNFYKLLDKNLSKSFLLLIIFMIIGTLLEVFSIALIVPVLGIIVDNEFAQKYELFRAVLEYLGQPSDELLVLYVSILFLLIYFVKASFLTFLSFKEASFIFKVQGSLSERLFSIYLSQPYSFNLDNNSSTLFRNINSANKSVREGKWDYEFFIGRQLKSLTVGVIGFGRLGTFFSNYCDAFGSQVIVYDPYKDVNHPRICQCKSLDELTSTSTLPSIRPWS